MKIVEIETAGFRAFSGTLKLDLAADAILVVAPNGQGKTSLFDAILWGLSGAVTRLGSDDSKLISLYSDSGEMSVRLTLKDRDGELFHIARSSDGIQQRFMLERGSERFVEAGATTRLLEKLWPAALAASEPMENFRSALTRSVYLQQDVVREFIESDSVQDRFNAISDLVGTGQITDLQIQLDNARTAWSRVTNERQIEANTLRERLLGVEAQANRLSSIPIDRTAVSLEWDSWWSEVRQLGIDVAQIPAWDTSDASLAIDSALKQLVARKYAAERSRTNLEQLTSDVRSRSVRELPDDKGLQKKVEGLNQQLNASRQLLKEAQGVAAAVRRRQVTQAQAIEELKALAQIALKHLDDRCPVCDQSYDKAATIDRLKRLADADGEQGLAVGGNEVERLANLVEEEEQALLEAQRELQNATRILREEVAWLLERDRRLREVLVEPTSLAGTINQLELLQTQLVTLGGQLNATQTRGEKLALQIARSAEGSRRAEIEKEIVGGRKQLETVENAIRSRSQAWDLGTRILEALREASTEFVDTELKRIEPLLQRIYARIDPHPSFKIVNFLTSFTNRRGRLAMSVLDPFRGISSSSPELVLSSSQLNALAVSVFLALNLGVPNLPLQAAMLDDPLQSLDDINLLGVIDLLRRTKDARQLLVSTHDQRFGELLLRKLRPVKSGQRTQVIELGGWTREGPIVDQRAAPGDLRPLKIAN